MLGFMLRFINLINNFLLTITLLIFLPAPGASQYAPGFQLNEPLAYHFLRFSLAGLSIMANTSVCPLIIASK